LSHRFRISPAHAAKPMIKAHGNDIIFSTVFYRAEEHGLQLIRIQDGETVYIPLGEEHRVGRVYSVRISPFDESEWLYRYRSGNVWSVDPLACSVEKTFVIEDGRKTEVMACSCSPLRAETLFDGAPERPLPPVKWEEQLIYGLHVKGFTAAKPDGFPCRGTFKGITEMIPYLLSIGVTAVELMPVYLPLPSLQNNRSFRTMQEALGAWPVGPGGDPLRDLKNRPNYWGYGRGLYCALRPEFGSQQDFAEMVRSLHRAGLRVLLQINFEKGISAGRQIDLLRFYIDRFGIDGFRLLGHIPSPALIAADPSLADTALFFESFPFEELEEELEAASVLCEQDLDSLFPKETAETGEEESCEYSLSGVTGSVPAKKDGPLRPARTAKQSVSTSHGSFSFSNLVTCGNDFQTLLRRFVKSDDYVMKDFLKLFLAVPDKHGVLRTVTGFDGFTLSDLVSYNERHNEANGEFGLDGKAENYSWNCGVEGPAKDHLILALRRKQMRNFLTLLMLAQGTPFLRQGDERCNSQEGNNNPYCQDNEISWVDWEDSPERRAFTDFTARLAAFRREHPVFRSSRPFQYIDYYSIGHPDVSLHGAEAWKPDLGAFSHSIGISYCENYADGSARVARTGSKGRNPQLSFVYLAINMYWEELSLALPKLPPHYVWKVFMDTDSEEGFLTRPFLPADQHMVSVPARTVRLLRAVPDQDSIARERKAERLCSLPPVGAVLRDLKRSSAQNEAAGAKIPSRTLRLMKNMIRPKLRGRKNLKG